MRVMVWMVAFMLIPVWIPVIVAVVGGLRDIVVRRRAVA